VSHEVLDALRARFLLDRLDRHLRDSSLIVAHCPGSLALRGVPSWDRERLREADRVALTISGVVLLIDLAPDRERAIAMRHWCRVQSAATPWRFHYRAVSVLRLLSGRGVIASGPARW
jgi:hypothetical protein